MIATNKPAVIAKRFLCAVVMEDCQRDGSLADSSRTYESDRFEVLSKPDDLLDQFAPSKALGGGGGDPQCTSVVNLV